MTFNLNDYVWVKIKPRGKDLLREHWGYAAEILKRDLDEIINYQHPINKEGYRRFQAYEMCNIFGPELRNGINPSIETTIIISNESLNT